MRTSIAQLPFWFFYAHGRSAPLIHSRIYAGQFLSVTLSASQRLRKLTASWSTRVRSLKSKTMGRLSASEVISVSNSVKSSASIRPLSLMTTSPFASLVILSIFLPLMRHFCNMFGRLWEQIETRLSLFDGLAVLNSWA